MIVFKKPHLGCDSFVNLLGMNRQNHMRLLCGAGYERSPMKTLPSLLLLLLVAVTACKGATPVDLSNTARRGSINIDGEMITVFKQADGKWAAYGGEGSSDPQRYITYRKERAIELKSHCRIDKRISKATDHILVASVKCA